MTPSSTNRRFGILLVLLAGIFWSTSGILYRLIQEATPWQVLLYRSLALLAALSLWLGWRYRGQVRDTLRKAGLPALAGGPCLGTAFSGYILALEYTTVANAMFLLTANAGARRTSSGFLTTLTSFSSFFSSFFSCACTHAPFV